MWRRDGFDEHGNPVGRAFDLGGVDDERLRGEKILLYVEYINEPYEWHHAQQAVAERQMQLDILKASRPGECLLNQQLLSQYSQLWLVSDMYPSLKEKHVRLIEEYVKAGNGLLIWADNAPYFADANILSERLIGTRFSGDRRGDSVLQPGNQVRPGYFLEHPLTQGVNRLYEGITISTIAPAHGLTMLAQSHDGQLCMACFERDTMRIVLDTGFTKLSQGAFQKTAGTARYFRNIAFWLAQGSRGREYTIFTPGRERIATIEPGASSERYKYTVTQPMSLTYLLHWEGSATLRLVVQNPDGRIVFDQTSGKAPIRCEITARAVGDWVCWVTGVQVPKSQFPYVLTLVKSAATSSTQGGVQGGSARPTIRPQIQRGNRPTYTKPWGATHPGCMIVLLDQSGSMVEPFGGSQIGAGKRKCDMVATVLNNLLYELVKTNTVGNTVKPRVDIAVLGYEGGGVRSALSGPLAASPFVSLPELIASPLRIETRIKKEVDDNGAMIEVPIHFPVWVEAMTGTATPMCAAFERAIELAELWAGQHPNNYPPVVINITDGASTDGDPLDYARALCSIGTTEGDTLLFNCHITNIPSPTVQFPDSSTQVPRDPEGLALTLFNLSSPIPEPARTSICSATGQMLPAGARGFIFNGDAAAVKQMFVYATVGATLPMVDPNR